jgi:hypothetical protein
MMSQVITKTEKKCDTCDGHLYIISQSSYISKSKYIKLKCIECNYETIETIRPRLNTV